MERHIIAESCIDNNVCESLVDALHRLAVPFDSEALSLLLPAPQVRQELPDEPEWTIEILRRVRGHGLSIILPLKEYLAGMRVQALAGIAPI
jgi:hypothetical protein